MVDKWNWESRNELVFMTDGFAAIEPEQFNGRKSSPFQQTALTTAYPLQRMQKQIMDAVISPDKLYKEPQ